MSSDTDDRVEQLERRLAEAESRLDALERQNSGPVTVGDDPYDRRVIAKLQAIDGEVRTSRLYSFYHEAGVHNVAKVKSRLRGLANAGLIEQAGSSRWRYVGPKQEQLDGVGA